MTRSDWTLATPRLLLRPCDTAQLRALGAGDLSSVTPATGWPTPDTRDVFAALTAEPPDPGPPGAPLPLWLVTLREGDLVVGDCGWKGGIGPDGSVEVGYGLASSWRGRGIGTEAVRALVDWTLGRPGCEVVLAEVEEGNIASQRLLTRLGFRLDRRAERFLWYARRRGRAPAKVWPPHVTDE
jgi:RimJ/RimL family protein N-acetyltransferase